MLHKSSRYFLMKDGRYGGRYDSDERYGGARYKNDEKESSINKNVFPLTMWN